MWVNIVTFSCKNLVWKPCFVTNPISTRKTKSNRKTVSHSHTEHTLISLLLFKISKKNLDEWNEWWNLKRLIIHRKNLTKPKIFFHWRLSNEPKEALYTMAMIKHHLFDCAKLPLCWKLSVYRKKSNLEQTFIQQEKNETTICNWHKLIDL